jgi:Uma2 family endonuclease
MVSVNVWERGMPISEETYRQIALEDPEGHWELYCGHLRQKPGMTLEHNRVAHRLLRQLFQQLDPSEFDARLNSAHVHLMERGYYIPDVFVVPIGLQASLEGTGELEFYDAPLPLVVEVWSRSTGTYDVETKLREYQRRGDTEIWLAHPYERSVRTWRRQSDGSYAESHFTGGMIRLIAFEDVIINLDALFD